jgi:hypothetical protein
MVDEYGVVGVGWIWRSVEVNWEWKVGAGLVLFLFPEVMLSARCSQCKKKRDSTQTETAWCWIRAGVGGYLYLVGRQGK